MNAARPWVLAGLLVFSATALPGEPPQPEKKEPAKNLPEKPIVVPFELLKSRHMAVDVKINGKGPYRLIFDTGAPTNLVNTRVAKDSGLVKKDDKGGFALFGMAGAKTIDTLEVGSVKVEKIPVMVLDHPTVAAISNALGPIDGLIGFPFFARFKMTIDYEKKEMTLEPNGYEPGDAMQAMTKKIMGAQPGKADPTFAAPAALWGFEVDKAMKDDDPGVVVKEVLKGGPADRGGLKAGDRLLTIDGRWTDSIADTFTAVSFIRPEKTVIVEVKRDGKEIKLSIKPVKGT